MLRDLPTGLLHLVMMLWLVVIGIIIAGAPYTEDLGSWPFWVALPFIGTSALSGFLLLVL